MVCKILCRHLIKSGDEKFRFKAPKAAKSEFREIFPGGADSADSYLYIVMNEKNEKISVIGYQKSPLEENAAFVTENDIKEKYRGKGLSSYLLETVIDEITNNGYHELTVGVEDDNLRARYMYEKCGFIQPIAHIKETYQCESYEYDLLLRKNKQFFHCQKS